MRRLIAARATVHIISYTEFVQQKSDNKSSSDRNWTASDQFRSDHGDGSDTASRHDSFTVVRYRHQIRSGDATKRKAYEAEVKKSQQALKNVAEETGGKMLLPLNSEEMLAQASEVARAIGAEYVVTYRPKRPLAEATPGEYRRIEVASRRVGLSLQSRRGYIVPTTRSNSHRRISTSQKRLAPALLTCWRLC